MGIETYDRAPEREQAPSVIRNIEDWRNSLLPCPSLSYTVNILDRVLTLLRTAAAAKKVRDTEKEKIALVKNLMNNAQTYDKGRIDGYTKGQAQGYTDAFNDAEVQSRDAVSASYGMGYAKGKADVRSKVETLLKESV